MRCRGAPAFTPLLLCCTLAAAKNKKKVILPADVLQAATVLVVIDPAAGTAVDAPLAKRTAQEDVEKAILQWGRFTLATDVSTADLVITVRKSNGRMAQPSIDGLPNNRPVIFEPTESGGRIGISRGTPTMAGDPTSPRASNPSPQVEVGAASDTFTVYRGNRDNPLASSFVWRYSAKDALQSPDVPAVEKFRKVIAEAEKQQELKP